MDNLEEKNILTWRSVERAYKLRGKEFFSTIIVLSLLVSIIMFFIEGLMPVLVIWAIIFVLWATNKTVPTEIEYRLTNYGIRVYDKIFPYTDMRQAWIEDKFKIRQLRIVLSRFPNHLAIVIQPENEKTILDELSKNNINLYKPQPTRIDNMVKWLSEKIPLE